MTDSRAAYEQDVQIAANLVAKYGYPEGCKDPKNPYGPWVHYLEVCVKRGQKPQISQWETHLEQMRQEIEKEEEEKRQGYIERVRKWRKAICVEAEKILLTLNIQASVRAAQAEDERYACSWVGYVGEPPPICNLKVQIGDEEEWITIKWVVGAPPPSRGLYVENPVCTVCKEDRWKTNRYYYWEEGLFCKKHCNELRSKPT